MQFILHNELRLLFVLSSRSANSHIDLRCYYQQLKIPDLGYNCWVTFLQTSVETVTKPITCLQLHTLFYSEMKTSYEESNIL